LGANIDFAEILITWNKFYWEIYAELPEVEIIWKVLCVRIHAWLRGHWPTNVCFETIARGAASVNILGRVITAYANIGIVFMLMN
jgi:hypothetical protein